MKKFAQDLRPGDVVRPFVDEESFTRTEKEVEIITGPSECEGAFQGIYIMFEISNNGVKDELFLQHEDEVEIIQKKIDIEEGE